MSINIASRLATQWWRECLRTALLCLSLSAVSVSAATVNGMYDAAVRITDNTEASKQAAFATALGMVASRVSGQRDAATKLGAVLNTASKYVQRYGFNSGFLEVGFDSAGVNSLLEQSGLPLWGRDRPSTLVIMPSTLQGVREARAAVEQTARLRGVPLIWAKTEVSERVAETNIQEIQALADRYRASGVLIARMIDPTSMATLRWQFVFGNSTQEIEGATDEGPHLAADVLGKYYAVADKETIIVALEVSGIDGFDAYGTTLNYLTSLSMVRTVKVDSVLQDVVRFHLELRGAVEKLRRGLELDQKLSTQQSAADATPGETLVYRLNGKDKS
jgi:hypothetical protein